MNRPINKLDVAGLLKLIRTTYIAILRLVSGLSTLTTTEVQAELVRINEPLQRMLVRVDMEPSPTKPPKAKS
jgi:hypothetical protein